MHTANWKEPARKDSILLYMIPIMLISGKGKTIEFKKISGCQGFGSESVGELNRWNAGDRSNFMFALFTNHYLLYFTSSSWWSFLVPFAWMQISIREKFLCLCLKDNIVVTLYSHLNYCFRCFWWELIH